jgi:hypothetical protein
MKIWAWGTVVISTLSLSVFACGGGKATTTTTGSPTGSGGSSSSGSTAHTSSTTGATTGGGGTPGAGGNGGNGGGAPACGITYDSRPACETCVENSCCSELMACGPGTDCNAFIACANACPMTNGQTCVQTCQTNHASGVMAFQAVTQCYDQNCRSMAACEYPICSSMLSFPDMTCAMCLGSDTGCCSSFTACASDMACTQCAGKPATATGCTSPDATTTAVDTCLNTTCGSSCTFSICGSMLGYPTAACNYCLSNASTGCCSQFDACTMDTSSTCYKCVTGAETDMATCMADANFTAYNTCFTTNCNTACGG